LHLGLSPFYRGSGTNFWPIVDGHLEYIGSTIHALDAGVDSGPIAHQGRPEIELSDTAHSIGCKAMLVGFQKMVQTLTEHSEGSLRLFPQGNDVVRICRRREFNADAVRKARRNLEVGLISRYVSDGRKIVPIVF
jgi:methionyl-tRNA formyltransferase